MAMRAHERMAAAIRQKIDTAEQGYTPGSKLPTVAELAVEYGVSTATADLAMLELKREGLVIGVRGGRMWVADGEPNGDDNGEDAA
jgi:DNA-binding GntR family transcriptional regulator